MTYLGCVLVTLIGKPHCVVSTFQYQIFAVIGSLVGSFLLKPTLEGNAEEWEGKLFHEGNLKGNINIVSDRT